MAVDGICRVFDMQGSTPRNDFCRMFAKEGLLDPLSSAMLAVANDDDELAQSALNKIVHILLIFAQSDLKVKMELAQRPIALRKDLNLLRSRIETDLVWNDRSCALVVYRAAGIAANAP